MDVNNKRTAEPDPYFDDTKSKTNINFDFVLWFYRILKYWYLFVISVAIFLAYAYIQNKKWVPTFGVQAVMLLEDKNRSSVVAGAVPTASLLRSTENQQIILNSYGLTERTVKQLPDKMRIDYFIQTSFKIINLYTDTPVRVEVIDIKDEAYSYTYKISFVDQDNCEISYKPNPEKEEIISLKVPFGQEIEYKFFKIKLVKTDAFVPNINGFKPELSTFNFNFLSEGQLIGMFNGRIHSNLQNGNATILNIGMNGPNPARDLDYLTVLLDEFQKYNLSLKNEQATLTIKFLDEQLKIITESYRLIFN